MHYLATILTNDFLRFLSGKGPHYLIALQNLRIVVQQTHRVRDAVKGCLPLLCRLAQGLVHLMFVKSHLDISEQFFLIEWLGYVTKRLGYLCPPYCFTIGISGKIYHGYIETVADLPSGGYAVRTPFQHYIHQYQIRLHLSRFLNGFGAGRNGGGSIISIAFQRKLYRPGDNGFILYN